MCLPACMASVAMGSLPDSADLVKVRDAASLPLLALEHTMACALAHLPHVKAMAICLVSPLARAQVICAPLQCNQVLVLVHVTCFCRIHLFFTATLPWSTL